MNYFVEYFGVILGLWTVISVFIGLLMGKVLFCMCSDD